MEIRDVRVVTLIEDLWKPWTLVFVETNTGLTGVGQVESNVDHPAVRKHLETVADRVVGCDPLNIKSIRQTISGVPGGSHNTLPGIELACWDIRGKHHDVPVHELLGGAVRDEVAAYANRWYGGCETPAEWADAAEDVVASGYDALKCNPFDDMFDTVDGDDLEKLSARLEAIRDRVGPGVSLLIEGHGRFTVAAAKRIGRRLEAVEADWFEAPISSRNPADFRAVREAIDVPIADDGPSVASPSRAFEFISAGALDVIQPDPVHRLGILGTQRIATIADATGVLVCPHAAAGPVSIAANVQLAAAIGNFHRQEFDEFSHPDWIDDVFDPAVSVEDGTIPVPQEPGLGITVDEAAAREKDGPRKAVHDITSASFQNSFE